MKNIIFKTETFILIYLFTTSLSFAQFTDPAVTDGNVGVSIGT